jgi:GTP-binding protein LepA
MELKTPKGRYILNLIDTPGHVDFSYEVSRSLAAVEGAILLVDATKGIQAQTLANLELARKQNLSIIPTINKIDLSRAEVEKTAEEISKILGKDEIIKISAKYGTNIDQLIKAIIQKIPEPETKREAPFIALIFDFKYEFYLWVIAYFRVFQGEIKPQEEVYLMRSKVSSQIKELGYFKPEKENQSLLGAGEIGWIALGIKEPGIVKIGDTIVKKEDKNKIKPLLGYRDPKPVVFLTFFPQKENDWDLLKRALFQLKLNDASFCFDAESSAFWGRGFRCGFLGILHAQIISERLRREFGLELIISTPMVAYKIIDKNNSQRIISSIKDFPHYSEIKWVEEQYVNLKIIVPSKFLGQVLKLLEEKKPKINYLSQERVILEASLPLREIIIGFYDKLKSASQGFASMDYEISGWQKSDLVKIEILIAKKKEEIFSQIVPRKKAQKIAQLMVEKLKEIIPSQLFSLTIQAEVEGRIIASRTIKAKRKDVLAPLYGGDWTRKRKLLERQKRGKEKLKERGKIRIPQNVLWKFFEVD